MLDEMIMKQEALQERLGYDFSTMSRKEITDFIKEFSIHLTQEVHEMLYELPYFKPWKDYDNMSTREYEESMEKVKEEYIDVLHFMLNLALALDMSAVEMHSRYMDKNKENHERQDDGYTHDKSYRR